ncbi:MAG TPA: hypothetical protein VFW10_02030 [Steroidobacteraceae bacterium]|nr:hypothetical protein [Steroidobacteraceae bacterium]
MRTCRVTPIVAYAPSSGVGRHFFAAQPSVVSSQICRLFADPKQCHSSRD